MKKPLLWLLTVFAGCTLIGAQTPTPSGAFTLDRVLDYPFPDSAVVEPSICRGDELLLDLRCHAFRGVVRVQHGIQGAAATEKCEAIPVAVQL